MRTIIKVLLLLVIVVIVFPTTAFFLFKKKEMKSFSFPENKVYRHKGGDPPNSIEGIRKTLASGVESLELDIFFDEKKGRFILAHDETELKNKKDELSSLSDVLEGLKKEGSLDNLRLWLDFKNLSEKNAQKSGKILKVILDKAGVSESSFVESKKAKALKKISESGLSSVYWLEPHPKSRIFYLRNAPIIWNILQTDLIAISMPYESYTDNVRALYEHLPVMLFTVNDPDKFDEFNEDEQVKAIITDESL